MDNTKTAEENKYAFEKYPELADTIMHAASFWKTDSRWSEHFYAINNVIIELEKEVSEFKTYHNFNTKNISYLIERGVNLEVENEALKKRIEELEAENIKSCEKLKECMDILQERIDNPNAHWGAASSLKEVHNEILSVITKLESI